MSAKRDRGSQLRALRLEAARWVLRLEARESDRRERCDGVSREEAFLVWLGTSPAHVRAFLESYETDRRVRAAARAGCRAHNGGRRVSGRSNSGGSGATHGR